MLVGCFVLFFVVYLFVRFFVWGLFVVGFLSGGILFLHKIAKQPHAVCFMCVGWLLCESVSDGVCYKEKYMKIYFHQQHLM